MNNELEWKCEMEDDAARMTAYDFAYKYGKYNLNVWDRVNETKPMTDEEEKDLVVMLGQINQFLKACSKIATHPEIFNPNDHQWMNYTMDKINKKIFQLTSKNGLTDINKTT